MTELKFPFQLAFKLPCNVLLFIYWGYSSYNSEHFPGQRSACLSGCSPGILWSPSQRRKAPLQAWRKALSGEPPGQPLFLLGSSCVWGLKTKLCELRMQHCRCCLTHYMLLFFQISPLLRQGHRHLGLLSNSLFKQGWP